MRSDRVGSWPHSLVVVALAPAADRAQQRLGVLAEQREQAELLVARREALAYLPRRGDVDRLLLGRLAADQLHGTLDGGVDRGRR